MNEPPTDAPRPPRFPTHRFWLVRSGETEDTSYFPDFTGHTDPALSARGRAQAAAIAGEFGALALSPAPAAVFSSPLAGAHATAEAIAKGLDVAGVEIHDAFVTVMPEELPPGRDGAAAFSMIQERAWAAVESLKERFEPDVNIIIVSHELPIRALIARALSLPIEDADRFGVDEASISAIEFRGPRIILAVLNDSCHLPENAGRGR